MKNRVFEGCATALITPFSENGVDYESFSRIIEDQIASGVSALVFAGTTGEAPTLREGEWLDVCRFAVKTAAGRVKVIVGCGSNSTETASFRVRRAAEEGADAALVVTPYYNKASPAGLVRHYEAVCSAADIPVIAYNVPSRTGVDLGIDALDGMVKIPNLAGIKEASGSAARASLLISRYGEELPVYSGCDEINYPVLSIGGAGIISVLSNIFPRECVKMCRLAREGRGADVALRMHAFVLALFSDVNPIPVKTVMAHAGWCRETFRLPMCEMAPGVRAVLISEYEKLKEKGLS